MLHGPRDLPLMCHLLTSWQPAWQLSHSLSRACEQVLMGLKTRIRTVLTAETDPRFHWWGANLWFGHFFLLKTVWKERKWTGCEYVPNTPPLGSTNEYSFYYWVIFTKFSEFWIGMVTRYTRHLTIDNFPDMVVKNFPFFIWVVNGNRHLLNLLRGSNGNENGFHWIQWIVIKSESGMVTRDTRYLVKEIVPKVAMERNFYDYFLCEGI